MIIEVHVGTTICELATDECVTGAPVVHVRVSWWSSSLALACDAAWLAIADGEPHIDNQPHSSNDDDADTDTDADDVIVDTATVDSSSSALSFVL